MFNVTQDFIFRQVRLALMTLGGFVVSRGYITSTGLEMAVGGIIVALTWAWSLWGNRLVAKVNEIAGNDGFLVIAPSDVVDKTSNTNVLPVNSTTVVAPAKIAHSVTDPLAKVESSSDVKVVPK